MSKEINQVEIKEVKRSQINFAPYNPKKHTSDAIKKQLKNLQNIGYLGGIVWDETTGNIVSGHKRVMAFDLHYKYDGTTNTDYSINVGVVKMDEKTEKEQNIYMDARSTNTEQDLDLIYSILPEIDYKNAGLTNEDIQFIGADFNMDKIGIDYISNDFEELNASVKDQKEQQKQVVKDIKRKIAHKASEKAKNITSYVVINFDNFQNKSAFMQRFEFDKNEQFINGELFSEMIERVD